MMLLHFSALHTWFELINTVYLVLLSVLNKENSMITSFYTCFVGYKHTVGWCFVGITELLGFSDISDRPYIADASAPRSDGWFDEKAFVTDTVNKHVVYVPFGDKCMSLIPIIDKHEVMVDLAKLVNKRFMPRYVFDSRYSSARSATSFVREGVYRAMLRMLDHLPKNIGIVYSECYRPLELQSDYYQSKFREIEVVFSNKKKAHEETAKHVDPVINNIPSNATGAVVSMSLFVNEDNGYKPLDMGTYETIFGPNYQQETFSVATTDVQRRNRLILLNAASKAGFANYGYAWWHFSYGDRMHAHAYDLPNASYGLIHKLPNDI